MSELLETPELDKISPLEWFSTKPYSLEQQKEIGDLLKRHIWITARRIRIPVTKMETAHINNCIKCFIGKGEIRIPTNYLGGREKWLKIFNEELIKRQ